MYARIEDKELDSRYNFILKLVLSCNWSEAWQCQPIRSSCSLIGQFAAFLTKEEYNIRIYINKGKEVCTYYQNCGSGSRSTRDPDPLHLISRSGSGSTSYKRDLVWIRVAHKKSTKIIRISYYFSLVKIFFNSRSDPDPRLHETDPWITYYTDLKGSGYSRAVLSWLALADIRAISINP